MGMCGSDNRERESKRILICVEGREEKIKKLERSIGQIKIKFDNRLEL